MGSSITKGVVASPRCSNLAHNATKIPTAIADKYRTTSTSPPFPGKKALVRKAYIGILAEQLMNGVRRIVSFLSLAEGSVLVAITAGTVQPKPISSGTMLLPLNPTFRSRVSLINATLAIYPLSSSIDRKKNRITITGIKLITVPTPENIPPLTNERTAGDTPQRSKAASQTPESEEIPLSNKS